MSNSIRARERRSRRSRMTKHQRRIMTQQHWGDALGKRKPPRADRDKRLAEILGFSIKSEGGKK